MCQSEENWEKFSDSLVDKLEMRNENTVTLLRKQNRSAHRVNLHMPRTATEKSIVAESGGKNSGDDAWVKYAGERRTHHFVTVIFSFFGITSSMASSNFCKRTAHRGQRAGEAGCALAGDGTSAVSHSLGTVRPMPL